MTLSQKLNCFNFRGIIPRLIGEVFTIWLSNFIAHLVNKYLIESKEMKSYTAAATGVSVHYRSVLMCMGTQSYISDVFSKGDNFCGFLFFFPG